ncbi:MAG: hypothetical protein ACLFS0_05835 [Bacteroidales bacterium]
MIHYIRHDNIDFSKWDHCIDHSVNGMFYAYSWYLDMTSDNWDALVEDDYCAVMPLPFRKKLSIKYIYQPFFIQQLGVFSTYRLNEGVTERFLEAIPGEFRFADFNLNTYNLLSDQHPLLRGKGITHELDLISPYAHLEKRYSANTRRNIKKARAKKVFVTNAGRPEDIIRAFRQNRGKQGVPFTGKDYGVLKHLIYAGMHKNMVCLRFAYSSTNNLCAGIVFFKSHHKVVLLFSGSTPEARNNGAMSLLIDHFIQEHAGKELVLDFEGSVDPGLARFYRGFGSEECVFLRIIMNKMPIPLESMLDGYRWIKNRCKRQKNA